jgi:hypothetical protein
VATFYETDANDWSLAVNAKGKLSPVLETDPVIAGGIKLYNRLQFFLGEWFLDQRQGIPYFQEILVKNPDRAVIVRLLRRVILSVPVIASVPVVELEYDPKTRKASFYFEALAADGRKISGGIGAPFIVDGRDLSAATATNGAKTP